MTRQAQLKLGSGAMLLGCSLLLLAITTSSPSGRSWLVDTTAQASGDLKQNSLASNSPATNPPAAPATTEPAKPSFYDEPGPYDLEAIELDPLGYYSQVVPSRVWQQAPAPAGQERHPELEIIGEALQIVAEHSAQSLRVRVEPDRPVTFTALDHGRFANGERSITLPSDEHGYAEAEFWTESAGPFRVLVGSPENHGPAEFAFLALPAEELVALESGRYARDYWRDFDRSPQAQHLLPHRAALLHAVGPQPVATPQPVASSKPAAN